MTELKPIFLLEELYDEAMRLVGSDVNIKSELATDIKKQLDVILSHSENAKGVLTVIITSAVYKFIHPEQDIRNHQSSILNGYSGRTFDTKYVTPFLKEKNFPSMAESGWLTRSLEQKTPYDENYPGAIRPNSLKSAFLNIIDVIQHSELQNEIISYLFQGLIIKRNAQNIRLAKPVDLPISLIIKILNIHFNNKYFSEGASRLPVLAIYAIYECLIQEIKRFSGKILLPIESHTSADTRSGRIGDIEIIDNNEKPFEAVEVKHGIEINLQLVKDAFKKFSTTQVKRYYILSTAGICSKEVDQINNEIERIKNIHGCNLIVNGIEKSLNYYLRLLDNTSDFIQNYVELLENDVAIKFEHKQKWNEIISNL